MIWPLEESPKASSLPLDDPGFHIFEDFVTKKLGAFSSSQLAIPRDPYPRSYQSNDGDPPVTRQVKGQQNVIDVLRFAGEYSAGLTLGGHIDDSWLFQFCLFAEEACAEIEQRVWAKLLIEELKQPATVARRTLHALRQMDVWEIEQFSEYCSFSFSFESGWRFMFAEDFAWRELWSYGRELDLTRHWVDIGLLSSKVESLNADSTKGLKLKYRESCWSIGDEILEQPSDIQRVFSYQRFQSIGQQIALGVKTKPFNGFARNVIKALNDTRAIGMVLDAQ